VTNSVVTFFAEMQKMLNTGLAKMGDSLKKAVASAKNVIEDFADELYTLSGEFKDFNKRLRDTEKVVSDNTTRWETFTTKLKKLKESIEIKADAAKKSGGGSSKKDSEKSESSGGILGGLKSLATSLFSKSNLTSLATKVITGGVQQEQDQVLLKSKLGDAGGQAAYNNIKRDAATTPFDTASLLAVNQSLVLAGASANSARQDTLALANAFAGIGAGNEELTRMASVMGELKKAGKASSEDLKQFSDAGIDIYQMLANASGKSVEDAKHMNVSYAGLSEAFRKAGVEGGLYAGAMEKQSQTVGGKFENFTERLTTGLGDVGVSFLPLLNRLLDFGLKLTDTLLPQIMLFIQPVMDMLNALPIESILNDVLSVVGAILAAVSPIITELQPLFTILIESLQPLIHSVGNLIVALVQGLAPVLALIVHIAVAILGPVIKILAKVFTWIVDLVTGIVKIISPIIEWLTAAIAWIVDGIVKFFGGDNENNGKVAFPGDKKKSSVSVTDAGAQKDAGLIQATPNTVGKKDYQVQSNKAAGEITSGGPRVININGVKFTDKIELHVTNAKEGLDNLEARFQEMFLRILNSGAAIQ